MNEIAKRTTARTDARRWQFSLRSILVTVAVVAMVLALPRWIGPVPTGFMVGAIVSAFLVWRFRTPGFLAGLLGAWVASSLGMHLNWAAQPPEERFVLTGRVPSPVLEILAIWLEGLFLAFVYLAPIYLARAIRDFYRIRSRLTKNRR